MNNNYIITTHQIFIYNGKKCILKGLFFGIYIYKMLVYRHINTNNINV